MAPIPSRVWPSALLSIVLVAFSGLADCFDPLDPNGNITVTFDIHQWTTDGYVARVTIQNYYQYRHVDKPGWKLGWTWAMNEVIWSMSGAFATEQGNCSSFKYQVPHSCKKDPSIANLMPDALPQNKSEDCCRGGLLSAWAINPAASFSSFEITVGNIGENTSVRAPPNLTLMAPGPGYTCSPVLDTDPTVSSDIGGRRQVQERGDQHALTRAFWRTKLQSAVFHFPHFTIPPSHHAPSAAVDAKVQTKEQNHT
ncbi:hypothetical protein I3843_06G120000 [Carya illinoinensis]|nr:hypothetical protein I3843_06G120000 [Carya illinoinensis]